MKGEYVEEKYHNNMFAKLHQTHSFHHSSAAANNDHHQQHTHHFQLERETHTSEEPDSSPSAAANKELALTNDGATIEVVRRPRGRPPGSKNRPKPPVIITRDAEPSMNPYVLELAGGVDIVDSLTRFCRKRNTGLCVLSGSGTVANVTLRQPSTTPGATVTFHGRFDILSISATVLPAAVQPPFASGFAISLAGPQGQIVGGAVVGSLIAAGTVYVIAASFNNPSYHRLPVEEDVRNISGSSGRSPSAVSGGGDSGHPAAVAEESCGVSPLYSRQLGSDVVWAPTGRLPPPPPQF